MKHQAPARPGVLDPGVSNSRSNHPSFHLRRSPHHELIVDKVFFHCCPLRGQLVLRSNSLNVKCQVKAWRIPLCGPVLYGREKNICSLLGSVCSPAARLLIYRRRGLCLQLAFPY